MSNAIVRLSRGKPPLFCDPFVRQLEQHGRHVLGCGGGVIPEPERAIDELHGRYGKPGLRDRCYALLFEQAPDTDYPEGVDWTAMGILYRLGDQSTFQKLLRVRHHLLQLSTATKPAKSWRRRRTTLDRCNWLLAGLCNRLQQPLPNGLAPLTGDEVRDLFA